MNITIKAMYALLILAPISACSAEEDLCATGNRLTVERVELKDALIEEMRKEKISTQESESGEICYPRDKVDYVRGKLIALDLEQRPANHITIAGGEFAQRVFLRLGETGIEYSYSNVDGKVVLVVAPEDIETIREITYSVAQSLANQKE